MKTLKKIQNEIEEIRDTKRKLEGSSLPESEKEKMSKELAEIMNKLEKEKNGIAIFTDEVFYGKAPTKFLRDPDIKLQAKGLYSVMHSYSQPKELMLNPKTFVSIGTLAKDTGLHRKNVGEWIKHLEEVGWITVKRRGMNKSNWYILHSKKRYRKN